MNRLIILLLGLCALCACQQQGFTSSGTPSCHIIDNMTSIAFYSPELQPTPEAYFPGQQVESVTTGGYTKWGQIEVCDDATRYVENFERTISLYLDENLLTTTECKEEACPLSFSIPTDITPGSHELRLVSGGFDEITYSIQIVASEASPP